jgi:predicted DCC family thiol-disulfide oxidoreductase YuxK
MRGEVMMRSTALQVTQSFGKVRVVADTSLHVIFDGDCAFCSSCARFLAARVRPSVSVRPWQEVDLESLGLTAAECAEALQCVVVPSSEKVSGHRAVALALRSCRFPWSLIGRVIGWRVLSPLGSLVYRAVANNRHRLPGGTPACKVTSDR